MIPQVATYPVDHMRCVSSASGGKFDVQSFMVCVSHCLNDIHCLAITYTKEHKECRMSRDETLIDCVLSSGDGSFTRTSRRKCMLNRQVIYQKPISLKLRLCYRGAIFRYLGPRCLEMSFMHIRFQCLSRSCHIFKNHK